MGRETIFLSPLLEGSGMALSTDRFGIRRRGSRLASSSRSEKAGTGGGEISRNGDLADAGRGGGWISSG